MTITDYYNVLGLLPNSSVEEIKKAYRKKARLYHPDINPSPDAKDLFICVTEAYEFLISNFQKLNTDDQAYHQAMEDWRKYRQDRSRKRAHAYARTSYNSFTNTKFYKTTRIFDGTTVVICFLTSIMIIGFTIYGYIFRLRHPQPDLEDPSFITFILLLSMGLLFFAGSFVLFKTYQAGSKKQKRHYR
jgi:DnaJ-class molecular chaperone